MLSEEFAPQELLEDREEGRPGVGTVPPSGDYK